MNILWSPEAIEDLNSLRAYIAQDNPSAARGVVLHIMHSIEQLLPYNPQLKLVTPQELAALILGRRICAALHSTPCYSQACCAAISTSASWDDVRASLSYKFKKIMLPNLSK